MISVTTRNDELNNDGDCSLREAIVTVNEGAPRSGCATPSAGANTIKLRSGSYGLKLTGRGEMASETGDLNITDPNTKIVGKSMTRTVVDANDIDRVFTAFVPVTFSKLEITGGNPGSEPGGGILAGSQDPIRLDRVRVADNETTGTSFVDAGGGIANLGKMTIINSEITRNSAPAGGGILQSGGTPDMQGVLMMKRSTLHLNVAGVDDAGAGLENWGESVLENVTISDNITGGLETGGGISLRNGSVDILHSTLVLNDPHNVWIDDVATEKTFATKNSVIAHPVAGSNCAGPEPWQGEVVVDGGNIDQDGTCQAEGTMQAYPELKPLGQYGGQVPTHALKPSSPAINESAEGGCVKTDARGAPRPRSGCASPGDNTQDLGAYELVRCSGTIVDEVGTPGRDRLVGSPQANGILALGGNDKVLGRGGGDNACGGDGADVLKGQDGDDRLLGQAGNDRLNGGPNSDTCVGGPGTDQATACEKERGL